MACSTGFRVVNDFACKELVAPAGQILLISKIRQQVQRLGINFLLGEVQVQASTASQRENRAGRSAVLCK